jgi:uncharacterized protein (TIGR02147 family)
MEKFRKFIKKEYILRQKRNPKYSLRAFAKYLKVDVGSLSQFINGRRNYSLKKMNHMAHILGLKNEETVSLIGQKPKDFEVAEPETFHLLSKWYYIAILELLELENFDPNEEWIAKKLGLSIDVVKTALDNLFNANVLILMPNHKWKNNWNSLTTQKSEDVDHLELRELQKQLLKLAEHSIDHNPGTKKSHSTYVSAVDESLVPEIKKEIKNFRRKIADLIENKSRVKNSVYCLQINFFPETLD